MSSDKTLREALCGDREEIIEDLVLRMLGNICKATISALDHDAKSMAQDFSVARKQFIRAVRMISLDEQLKLLENKKDE